MKRFLGSAFCLSILLTSHTFANEIFLNFNEDKTKMSLNINLTENFFPKEFEVYLMDGIAFEIDYTIDIKKRSWLKDEVFLKIEYNREVKYDYWLKKYVSSTKGLGSTTLYYDELPDLLKELTVLQDIPIKATKSWEKGDYYVVVHRRIHINNMKDFFYTLFEVYYYLRYGYGNYESGSVKLGD